MPSRKQRRRRAKEQRHEYVWEDAEGNELEPEEAPTRKTQAQAQSRPARSGRVVQAPSWSRTLKRGAIFAPIMFVVVMLLSSDLSLAQQLIQTAIIVAIFIPFSYFLDTVFWRSYQKRHERREGSPGRRGG
jgi:ferric-dicitrate binding protein FerR (iron transport regulator)